MVLPYRQLIGADISVDALKVCRLDQFGDLSLTVDLSLPQPAMPGAVTVALCDGINTVDPDSKATLIGVSCPGQIDSKGRILKSCDVLTGWNDVPFADWLELRLSRKVVLIHSTQCLICGEAFYFPFNSLDCDLMRTLGAALLARKSHDCSSETPNTDDD